MTTTTQHAEPERSATPSRAVLGRIVTGSVLTAGLVATICLGTYWTASAMQAGLLDEARTTLDAKQLTATVMMSGRDAYVWAKTPTERADAIAALRTIPGVRVVLVGDGALPVRGAVVALPAQADPLTDDTGTAEPATRPTPSVPATITPTRQAVTTPSGRPSTTRSPSITMTKEG